MSTINDTEWPLSRHDVRRESAAELVRLASNGRQDAWSELVGRFDGLLRGVAKRNGLSDSDAADIAQMTWLHLMRTIDRIRDPCRIAGWLATTARRESIRFAIGATRQTPSADPCAEFGVTVPSQLDSSAEDALLRTEFDPSVESALGRLPATYRRLIALLISDARLSYTEIAEVIGVPVGSIGPMRLRCLEMLRRDPGLAHVRLESAA